VSATPIPSVARGFAHREPASRTQDARRGARRIALLAAFAAAVWLLVAPFDGIVLFVAGLALLAAYAAATHPHPEPVRRVPRPAVERERVSPRPARAAVRAGSRR
jgi:hypothetical protein